MPRESRVAPVTVLVRLVYATAVMPPSLPGSVAKRLAVATLMALVALSLGCGKSETARGAAGKSAAKPAAKPGADTSIALPDEFPRDVPIFRNAALKAAVSQGDHMIVQLYTMSSIKEAIDYYNGALKSEGWTIETAPPSTGDMFVISAKKGSKLCSVTIARDGKGTLIRLAVSPARS